MDLETLKTKIQGRVITPDNSSHNTAKEAPNHDHPAVVVQVADTQDVKYALEFARSNNLILSVRSGGHSAYSTNDGGVVIDLKELQTVERLGGSTVQVGAGATWGDITERLSEWNLAISSGDTISVGVGGLTVGGGIGWMVRKHGLTIDSLLAVDLVTANGQEVRASASENTDLFWAIRGGGGNFGIITSFEFQAYENRGIFAGTITYDRQEMESILKKWRDYMRRAPEELSVIINTFPTFGETPAAFMLSFCFDGTDEAAAMRAINPLLELGKVSSQEISRMPYKDILENHSPGTGKAVRIIVHNAIINDFSDNVIQIVARKGLEHNLVLQIRSLGGAMNRVHEDATAFAHRHGEVMIVNPNFFPATVTPQEIEKSLAPWYTISAFSAGSYVNFLTEAVNAAYPQKTLQKLEKIKAKYDPNNLFNQNHNILPRRET